MVSLEGAEKPSLKGRGYWGIQPYGWTAEDILGFLIAVICSVSGGEGGLNLNIYSNYSFSETTVVVMWPFDLLGLYAP